LSNLGKVFGSLVHRGKKAEENQSENASTQAKGSIADKIYLKAFPLRKLSDIDLVKQEVNSGNIMILKISPLASKSVEEVKRAVNELYEFTQTVGGDIARLGEERVVVTPSSVRIWREKQPMPPGEMPTAA